MSLIELRVDERIANGVALLDKHVGEGWELLINLNEFRIEDGSRCVLGQLFGERAMQTQEDDGYCVGLDVFGSAMVSHATSLLNDVAYADSLGFSDSAAAHGFEAHEGSDEMVGPRVHYYELQPLWKQHIKAKQDRLMQSPFAAQVLKERCEKRVATITSGDLIQELVNA